MKISDEKLYQLCKQYGATALEARRKFIGLLPEVHRRRLYEKKGFSSIFEFGAKLCGLSQEQVRLTLNLEKRFEEMPTLKSMLENGEASINKLARIVSIATPENEEELAASVNNLSMSALNTLVQDEKLLNETPIIANENGFFEPIFEDESLFEQTVNFRICEDVAEELNDLNAKGIDVNDLLREMLKKHKAEIAEKKARIATEIIDKHNSDVTKDAMAEHPIRSTDSRYIPVAIKNILKQEHGDKCSIAHCLKPAEIIHHTQRFSLSQNHDPHYLAPLCKDHHLIAHSVDLKFHQERATAML